MGEDSHVSGDFSQAAAAPDSADMNVQTAHEPQEQSVPLAALQAERAQRQKMEDELRLIKDHLLLQASQTHSEPKVSKDEFDGMSDGDVLTVGEAKKFMQRFGNQLQMSVEEMKMNQRYPDYAEVVTKYLPEVFKTNPGLRQSLAKTQDYELAYYMAKQSDAYRSENKKARRNSDAERILQNSQQPGSLSSVGGASTINTAKQYSKMSDDDFRKEVAKNLGYT